MATSLNLHPILAHGTVVHRRLERLRGTSLIPSPTYSPLLFGCGPSITSMSPYTRMA
jgi:hypothetical protein